MGEDYHLNDDDFNNIRIAISRMSTIGDFIANMLPDKICNVEQFCFDVGGQLVQDASKVNAILTKLEELGIAERNAREKVNDMKKANDNNWRLETLKKLDDMTEEQHKKLGIFQRELLMEGISESTESKAESSAG